jgi:uncharacterized membrane protein
MFSAAAVPGWFLTFGLLMGTSYALFMGPLRVPDESGHFLRAYAVSRGKCIGPPAIASAADWRDLNDEAIWIELPPQTTARDVLRLIKTPQDAWGGAGLFTGINLYSCVPYIASGISMSMGGLFTHSWLKMMYLGRLANLAVYLSLIYVALRILPEFRLVMAGLALMPMALHQAASLSSDSVSIAFAFLWAAFIVKVALDERVEVLRPSQYLLIAAGAAICALLKANAGLVLLILVIPAAKFRSRRSQALSIAAYIVLAYGVAALWQYANRVNWQIFIAVRNAGGVGIEDNVNFILHHTFTFLSAVGRTVLFFKYEYLQEFVGTLGWLTVHLPVWLAWTYVALLLAAVATQASGARLSTRQRFVLAGVFILNVASLYAAIWSWEMPRAYLLNEISAGRGILSGVQGRYLISWALLPLLALSARKTRVPEIYMAGALLTFALVANLIALHLVWNEYQAHTSTLPNRIRMAFHLHFTDSPQTAALRYDGRLIRRRGSSEEDQRVYFVTKGAKHLLQSKDWMVRNGYKWPDDVLIVAGADLESIPVGEAIVPVPVSRARYEGNLVRRPGPTPEDSKVYVVQNGVKHWVLDRQWITSHGYHWPVDVITISREELDAIPAGEAVGSSSSR